jgi:phosphoglycerate dehydrogenase-like enzyme
VSRGSLRDEMALVRALKEPGGAALDVTAIEPLAPESPLWKTPHLMITPHPSVVSDRLWKRQTEILAGLPERCFGGRELFNCVDLSRGY